MGARIRWCFTIALAGGALWAPAIALSGAAGAQTPAVSLSREDAARAYQQLTADTVAATEASNELRDKAWASRDPVLIDQDMRSWVRIRTDARRDLRRARFFPTDLKPQVATLIEANSTVISVYRDAIASLESGQGITSEQHRAMSAADINHRLAGEQLRSALGLPPRSSTLNGQDEPSDAFALGRKLGQIVGPLILIGLVIGAILGANAVIARRRYGA